MTEHEAMKWQQLKKKNIEVSDQIMLYDNPKDVYTVVAILGYQDTHLQTGPDFQICATISAPWCTESWGLTSKSCKLYSKKGVTQLSIFDVEAQI